MDCGRVQQARANPDLARHHRGAACAWGGVSLLPSKCLCWAGAAFSRFFSAVLDHNGIKDLHLQPNSILLLSFLAFYYEAFIGVQRSVAVLRHCFSLLLQDGAHLSARVSFLAAESGNVLLKAGKNLENFRQCWVLMCLKDANPRLVEPKGLPEKTSTWSLVKFSDPCAVPVLERFSRDISAKKLTGGMIVKDFLAQRLVPL
ncbi:hypothetical protein D1007_53264 [Hordeum vulgare]|nr:hypothetical protein D1007_53264 [Hordeum vulgare]